MAMTRVEMQAATWRSRFLAAKRDAEQEPRDDDKHVVELDTPGCRQIGAVRYE